MTHPETAGATAVATPQAEPDPLLLVLQQLVDEAAGRGIVAGRVRATGPADALARLVRGTGSALDEAAFGADLTGGRLVHVSSSSEVARQRLTLPLEGDRVLVLDPTSTVHLIGNSPRRAGEDRALLKARRLAVAVLRSDPLAAVGISAPLDSARDVPGAAADARDAAVLAAQDAHRCVEAAASWAELALRRLRPQLDLGGLDPLRRLVDYDREHGTEFVRSLATWLARDRDTAAAAADLCVHANTLRYRVRRACALAQVDLDDPHQRLVIGLLLSA